MTPEQFAFVLYTAARIRATSDTVVPASVPHGAELVADQALEAAIVLLRRAELLRAKYGVSERAYDLFVPR